MVDVDLRVRVLLDDGDVGDVGPVRRLDALQSLRGLAGSLARRERDDEQLAHSSLRSCDPRESTPPRAAIVRRVRRGTTRSHLAPADPTTLGGMTDRDPVRSNRSRPDVSSAHPHTLSRRTFLKVGSASALGLLAARPVLAATRGGSSGSGPSDAEAGPDPITAQANGLDFDRERIFRFVSDEIRYEPYPGVLRGARGTLESRAGNSADQALLLAAMLEAAAIQVRYVAGAITAEQGDALLASASADLDGATRAADAVLRGTAAARQPATALPQEAVDFVARIPEQADAAIGLLGERVDRSVAMLVDALRAAGIDLPDGVTPIPALELEQHVWLQAASGPEWLDLDPSMPGQEPGIAMASPVGEAMTALPDSMRHRVDFVVTAESVVGSGVAETAIIEHSAFADEVGGRPVSLTHEKPGGLQAIGIDDRERARRRDALPADPDRRRRRLHRPRIARPRRRRR